MHSRNSHLLKLILTSSIIFYWSPRNHPSPVTVFLNQDNLQKAAILYTKVYAKHCFKNKHIANISELASSLMNFLGDNGISLKLRKFIAGTLDYILQCDRECTIKKYFFSNSLSLLQKAIESNFNNIDPVFIGFYVQIILSSSLNLSQ